MTVSIALAGRIGPGFQLDAAAEWSSHGVTCLLGPSGSGKTTVLRALAGLDRVPGTIRLDDAIWQDARVFVPPHRRRVGYVFQGAGLLPHLTVGGNLDYALARAPPGPFERDAVIGQAGIAHLLDRRPARLSGGEAQRAGLARALMGQPGLLLLDEPLTALDSGAKAELLGHLSRILADLALPVVYVTHDEAEADRIAARVVRLDGGRVVSVEERG